MNLAFPIPIVPRSWERAGVRVVTPRHGKAFATHFTPTKTRATEEAIGEFASEHVVELLGDPLSVFFEFIMRRPKTGHEIAGRSWPNRVGSTVNPDLDNMVKCLLDGLNEIVYVDDSQVVELRARKIYAAEGERPHINVSATTDLNETVARLTPDQGRLL